MAERTDWIEELQQRIETTAQDADAVEPVLKDEILRALQELRVHQAELEVQNQELRQAHLELEASRDRYSSLYQHAPVGYVTIDATGIIQRANMTMSTLVATPLAELIGKPFADLLDPASAHLFRTRLPSLMRQHNPKSMQVHFFDHGSESEFEALIRTHPSSENSTDSILLLTVSENTEMVQSKKDLQTARNRLEHMNSVLRSIRKVNRMIGDEKDQDRMLQSTCDLLVHERGFHNVWIALLDDQQQLTFFYEAGIGEYADPFTHELQKGNMPRCVREAMQKPGLIVIDSPKRLCSTCPLSSHYEGRSALTCRLEADGVLYGVMTFSAPEQYARDHDQLLMLDELAHDISYGLRNLARAKDAERWHRAMMGRENRIIELKQEVNHLLREMGRPHRYEHT